jgi:hypothetical protein
MKASVVTDTDGDQYPDPLTAPYNSIQYTQETGIKQIGSGDIAKFWLFMLDNYGIQDLDDVLLSINQVPYIGYLEPGDFIYLIDFNDIQNFTNQTLLSEN